MVFLNLSRLPVECSFQQIRIENTFERKQYMRNTCIALLVMAPCLFAQGGDTMYTDDASATAGLPIPGSSVSAAIYPNGLNITGGTGRFAGASGE
jgi:hypothetical protein